MTITTITVVVSGMEATVVVVAPTNTSMLTAQSANAKILSLSLKRIVTASVPLLGTRVTKFATMETTTVPVTGMAVTAADRMVAKSKGHTAKSVSVSTLRMKVSTVITNAPVEGNVVR